MTAAAAVVAVALVLLPVLVQAADESVLYEMTWQSQGAPSPFEMPWTLGGTSMAILKPLSPSERVAHPRASHRLVFLWQGQAHGGPLPTDDDAFAVPAPVLQPPVPCGRGCRGLLDLSPDGDRFTAWYFRGSPSLALEFHATGRRVEPGLPP